LNFYFIFIFWTKNNIMFCKPFHIPMKINHMATSFSMVHHWIANGSTSLHNVVKWILQLWLKYMWSNEYNTWFYFF
jgi:hypothetical protein